MTRQYWKPANLLNPVPCVLISCADEEGNANFMTAAWAGTVCSDPVMVSVSIRKSRYSHDIIEKTGEFVMNLTTEDMVRAVDYAGIYSGRKTDKFNLKGRLHLTEEKAHIVRAPCIKESPICLECKVKQILRLGSHDMFVAEVVSTDVDDRLLDETGRLDLHRAHLIAYSHGEYFALGKKLGKFGFTSLKTEKKANLKDKFDNNKKKHHRKKSQR
ncbi:MAG: flavin reductase family protein [Erysipelotrichaceae bacterium]|nr:flavin reductase family protein [Erysipelotrichaceae bacterium]